MILALDGLEYSSVQEFNLRNLQQKEYGKVDISDCATHNLIASPTIWASFITGKTPQEHKIDAFRRWESTTIQKFKTVRRKIFGSKFHFEPLLKLLGFKKRVFTIKDLKMLTIFDHADPSITLDVPFLNENALATPLELWKDFVEGSFSKRKLEQKLKQSFSEKSKELFDRLRSPFQLLMAYFHEPDHFGHLYIHNKNKMRRFYSFLDHLVSNVSAIIDKKSTLFLVISDHGMKTSDIRFGAHSDYGFYSVNQPLNLNYPKITNFYEIIINALA